MCCWCKVIWHYILLCVASSKPFNHEEHLSLHYTSVIAMLYCSDIVHVTFVQNLNPNPWNVLEILPLQEWEGQTNWNCDAYGQRGRGIVVICWSQASIKPVYHTFVKTFIQCCTCNEIGYRCIRMIESHYFTASDCIDYAAVAQLYEYVFVNALRSSCHLKPLFAQFP